MSDGWAGGVPEFPADSSRVEVCGPGELPRGLRRRAYVRVEVPRVPTVEGTLVEVAQWPLASVTVESAQTGQPTVVFLTPGTRIVRVAEHAPPPHPAL